jgi:DNA gyrase subunit A
MARSEDDVIVVTERGQAIRFAVAALRAASRSSGGVRAIHLTTGDRVVAMDITSPEAYLLVVTTNGYGKCTLLTRYRPQTRGGIGIKSISISPKSGGVAAARVVEPSSGELLILSTKGVIIRLKMESIPIQGRIRKGASLMRLDEGDEVASIAAFSQSLL